jgi:hypothetical protein
LEGLERLRELPVLGKLVRVQLRPFTHEAERTWRKRTVENLERLKLDLGDVLTLLGVEVRGRVVGPIHVNHDSVEGGQPRHAPIFDD